MASRTLLPRLLAASRPAIRPAKPALRRIARPLSTTPSRRKSAEAAPAANAQPTDAAPAWLHEKVGTAALWLRDSCRCPICVSPSSGQKSFATPDIPSGIRPRSVRVSQAGELAVEWENDIPGAAAQGHVSTYSPEYLDSLKFRKRLAEGEPNDFSIVDRTIPYQAWNAATIKKHVDELEYEDFMAGGDAYWKAIFDLEAFGLVFLKNVPREEGAVADVGLKVGNLQETFYGRTWDVVSKPDAENVAYTNAYLGLHEDMLYIQQPPRIQLLHCIENSCEGGESIFSDGNHAALSMMNDPAEKENVEMLRNNLVRYHYNKHPFFYRRARPVFNVKRDDEGSEELVNIWWSPPFQAPNPPYGDDEGMAAHRAWLGAMKRFEGLLSAEENVYEVKLEPGQCVLFDNRRVLHGRKAFNTGAGTRWLRGTYVSDEDFRSRMRSAKGKAVEGYVRGKGLEGGKRVRNAEDMMAGYGSLGGWLSGPGGLPAEALEGRLGRA